LTEAKTSIFVDWQEFNVEHLSIFCLIQLNKACFEESGPLGLSLLRKEDKIRVIIQAKRRFIRANEFAILGLRRASVGHNES